MKPITEAILSFAMRLMQWAMDHDPAPPPPQTAAQLTALKDTLAGSEAPLADANANAPTG